MNDKQSIKQKTMEEMTYKEAEAYYKKLLKQSPSVANRWWYQYVSYMRWGV